MKKPRDQSTANRTDDDRPLDALRRWQWQQAQRLLRDQPSWGDEAVRAAVQSATLARLSQRRTQRPELTPETLSLAYERLLDANVRTLVNATGAVLPGMLARGGGFVAGISSHVVWEGTGAASMSLYAAAKAAVAFYLRSVEREVRGAGVRVAVVYPLSPIDTPANRRSMPDADPAGWVAPAAIAEALLFAATRGPRGRITELPIGAAPPGRGGRQ